MLRYNRFILKLLHRVTSGVPFPVLEPILLLCLARRRWKPALAVAVGMVMVLWYPAYFISPAVQYEVPDDVEALCGHRVDELNRAMLEFDDPFDTAGDAAGLAWARVKPVRWPEWMHALGIAGLFSPWTGEALADGSAPPGYLPFTCVHELMHLKGIADEGEANIEAYRACMDFGGMYADSARLWALRYGLGRLDEDARRRVIGRAGERLPPFLLISEPRRPPIIAQCLGIGRQTGDYDALLGYLAANTD